MATLLREADVRLVEYQGEPLSVDESGTNSSAGPQTQDQPTVVPSVERSAAELVYFGHNDHVSVDEGLAERFRNGDEQALADVTHGGQRSSSPSRCVPWVTNMMLKI